MSKGFERHARTFTLLTVASRLSGLVRDAALARAFGLGPAADAFNFAFQLPNLFRRLFGEGALSSSLIPAYTKELSERGDAAAGLLAWRVLSVAAIALGSITLLAELVLAGLHLMQSDGSQSLTLSLFAITLPYMPLVCLVALTGAVLQVHHRFGPTATAPVILNLMVAGMALAGWLAYGEGESSRRVVWVAIAVVAAGCVQLLWTVLALRGTARVTPGRSAESDAAARKVWVVTIPMILGLGVLQLNTFIDGLIASWPTAVGPTILGFAYPLPEGSMATLTLAQRLYEFPLGVFGVAIATAIFPQLAREASHPETFVATLRRGLRVSVFIGAAASAGLFAIAAPLATVLYEGGEFTAADAQRVTWVVSGYAPAVWAYSVNQLFVRAFYAQGDMRTPVRVSVGMVFLNLTLNLILIWTPLGVAGLAWSTCACAVIQCFILHAKLKQRLGVIAAPEVRRSLAQSAAIAVLMGVATMVVLNTLEVSTWGEACVALAVGTTLGAGMVVGAASLFKMPELSWSLGRASS